MNSPFSVFIETNNVGEILSHKSKKSLELKALGF